MNAELTAAAAALGLEIRRSAVAGQWLVVSKERRWVLMGGRGLADEDDVARLLASRGAE